MAVSRNSLFWPLLTSPFCRVFLPQWIQNSKMLNNRETQWEQHTWKQLPVSLWIRRGAPCGRDSWRSRWGFVRSDPLSAAPVQHLDTAEAVRRRLWSRSGRQSGEARALWRGGPLLGTIFGFSSVEGFLSSTLTRTTFLSKLSVIFCLRWREGVQTM